MQTILQSNHIALLLFGDNAIYIAFMKLLFKILEVLQLFS